MQVGRDPRISGQLMTAALTAGLASKGVSVGRFGIATTPAMFLSCISEGMFPLMHMARVAEPM
jgi:phosphomannomutase